MPRFNTRGDWNAGVGGDGIHALVNGQIVDPGPGGAGDWLTDDEFVGARWTNWDDFRTVALSQTGVQRELRHGAVGHVYAGGGRWGTLAEGHFILDDGSEVLPIVGFGRDGCLVTWASGSNGLVIAGRQVTAAVIYESHILDANTAIWLEPDGPHTIGMPVPRLLPGPVHGLRVAFDGSRWWALYQAEYNGQLVLHPFDSFVGYALNQPFDPHNSATWAYRPDLVILDGLKHVIWATIASEQFGQIAGPYVADTQFALVDLFPSQGQPPKITVSSYDALLKAAEPWHLEFTNTGDGTRFIVTKDVRDRLWIEADNAAGHDRTGTVRQLTIEGPDPEPEPEPEPPPMLRRYWFQPNIGSKDLLDLFDDPSHLLGLDVVVLYAQHVLTDVSTPQLGPNTWPNFVAHDSVQKLKAAGRPLVIEMGSVKDGDCQARANIAGMQEILQRVHDAGGQVAAFSADEPITNSRACHQSLAQTAEGHATWTHAVRALGPIEVGWLEAWPAASLDEQRLFLQELKAHDALPDYWHLDINWKDAEHQHKNPAAFIDAAKVLAAQYGITLGIFVNATVDPIPTDLQHHQNVLALAQKIYGLVPDIAHVSVAAWAHRVSPDPTHATQNVPNNLGAAGLLQTFTDVAALFAGTPPPTEEIDPMLYKLMDPTTQGIIRLKQLKPLDGTPGKFTAVLPDDRVASIQPDGSYETRDPGTTGEYEQCYAADGLLFYQPQPEKRYAWAYRLLPA
jgi:hypothetical protein